MEDVGKKKPYTVRDTSIVQKDKDVKAVEAEKDVYMFLVVVVEVFNKLIYYIYNILLTKSIFFYSLNI
jgi:hypothetical protein